MEQSLIGTVLLSFEFHPEDGSITCNHRYLTKGVSALILKHVLETFSHEGRRYFEYREFKRDRRLFPMAKATNFEVRFRRLIGLLEERIPEVILESDGPGRFRFRLRDAGTVIEIVSGARRALSDMSITGKRNVSHG